MIYLSQSKLNVSKAANSSLNKILILQKRALRLMYFSFGYPNARYL